MAIHYLNILLVDSVDVKIIMKVRKVNLSDKNEWERMRNQLWSSSSTEHLAEIDRYFSNNSTNIVNVMVLERNSGKLGGLIELNIRNYAEGSKLERVPYVEGWYVDQDLRKNGYGKQLMAMAEEWAIENGFSELVSDTELTNYNSIAIHQSLGFKEVGRIVCFIKSLTQHS